MDDKYWMGLDDYYRSLEPEYETEEDYNDLYSRPIEYSPDTVNFIEESGRYSKRIVEEIWGWLNNQDYDVDAEWSYVNELSSGE